VALDEWLAFSRNGQLPADGNSQAALQYTWPHVADQYLQVYEQVCQHV